MTINKYCIKLELPVCVPIDVDTTYNPDKSFHFKFNDTKPEFNEWLDQNELYWIHGGYFYSPAHKEWTPHIDGHKIFDFCKINWRFGSSKSVVEWYEPKEDSVFNLHTTLVNSQSTSTIFATISEKQLDSVFVTEHPPLCMFNGGRIHRYKAGPTPDHVVTIILGSKSTNKVLSWDEAEILFKDYIK